MPHALIVGASRGLGLGLVRGFVGRGWQVTGTVRREADGHAVRAAGGTVLIADMTRPADVEALHDAISMLDLLLVNGGISGPATAGVDEAALGHLFMTNAVAPVQLARRLMDRVRPEGIVAFMSSLMGSVALNSSGNLELYRASKAALNSLTRSMVAQLDREVRVLTLHPGWVQTDMGGAGADLDVETSVRGLVDVILADRAAGSLFLDYTGRQLAW